MITPSFGVADAYGDDIQQYNNAVGFFMICTGLPDSREQKNR